MRYVLLSTKRVLHQSRLLKKELRNRGCDVKLSHCHEIMAKMLGYRNYQELFAVTGSRPPSPGDSEVSPQERQARRGQHVQVLLDHGVSEADAVAIVEFLKPTDYAPLAHIGSTEGDSFEEEWGLRRV